MRSLILTVFLLLATSCSTSRDLGIKNQFTFDFIARLTPGSDDQNKTKLMLGSPDFELPLDDTTEVLWIYKDKKTGYQKLSLVFDAQKKLQSVLWIVSENEREIRLDEAKKHFAGVQFVNQDVTWKTNHTLPDESVYVDENKGVSILLRKSLNEVQSIGWYKPIAPPQTERETSSSTDR